MNKEKESSKKVILLISNSPYYPVFFKHYFPNFLICTLPSNSEYIKIEKTEPDLIIIDDQDYKESIFLLCSDLKKRPKFTLTPLVVISAVLKTQYLEKLSQIGVSEIIQEPLNPEALAKQFEELLLTSKSDEKLKNLKYKITDLPSAADIRLRPFFNKNLLAPVMLSLKEKKRVSVLAIDIEYNEVHEYTERHITEVIKKVFPENHPLISLGKGKYILFLNETPVEEAYFLGETLRDVVTNTLHIGIKIGICSQKKPPYANIREMILAAKMALLEAQKKRTSIEIH